MKVTIENLETQEGTTAFRKLLELLNGARLLDKEYRFEDKEKKCIFEIMRFYIEKPIKESIFLFFKNYRCGTIKSILEISPVLKVEESKKGYEDFEMDFDEQRNAISVGTYKHTFHLFLTGYTKLVIHDVGDVNNVGSGYYPRKYWTKLNRIIEEINK
jgi:hypothetical protein